MVSFGRIEELIEKGDVLTLNQMNEENSYEVAFAVSVAQENIDRYYLSTEMTEQLGSMFPRIKFYMGYHACYFQAKYDSESKKFLSTIMIKNFHGEDSSFRGLSGSAENLLDSMLQLEETINMLMQESVLLQKVKIGR